MYLWQKQKSMRYFKIQSNCLNKYIFATVGRLTKMPAVSRRVSARLDLSARNICGRITIAITPGYGLRTNLCRAEPVNSLFVFFGPFGKSRDARTCRYALVGRTVTPADACVSYLRRLP